MTKDTEMTDADILTVILDCQERSLLTYKGTRAESTALGRRFLILNGRETSLDLEPAYWNIIDYLAKRAGTHWRTLVSVVLKRRHKKGKSRTAVLRRVAIELLQRWAAQEATAQGNGHLNQPRRGLVAVPTDTAPPPAVQAPAGIRARVTRCIHNAFARGHWIATSGSSSNHSREA